MKLQLLSVNSDAKTIKGLSKNFLTAILYLAPYTLSGKNVCPMAEKAKCHIPCLNTAGRGKFNNVQLARIRKTQWFQSASKDFLNALVADIEKFKTYAVRHSYTPCVRLNGTSDIRWENYGVIDQFKDVQFYDYHKALNRKNIPPNYHLTYSFSGAYPKFPVDKNWAVVFDCKLPETFCGRKVINGDETDLRFLDPDRIVVGLKAKGRARKDESGFVVRDPVLFQEVVTGWKIL